MKKSIHLYISCIVLLILSSCSVNKYISQGSYLLDDVEIVSDTKSISSSSVINYVRQKPNSKWFNVLKVPLGFYCMSGKDSTVAINRILRKIGEAPEIYDHFVALKSRDEIEKAIKNKGYMQGKVILDTIVKKNKVSAVYTIHAGKPYVIRHIAYNIDDLKISEIIEN